MNDQSCIKLKDLILGAHWLSVKTMILDLYPDQSGNIGAYEEVFERLQFLEAIQSDMILIIKPEIDEETGEPTIPDVYGKKPTEEYGWALEFTSWGEWLGMAIDQNTLNDFDTLEIIAHCLYEMTFIDFEEDEIQHEFSKLNQTVEDFKNLTPEEKEAKTTSLEDLMKEIEEHKNEEHKNEGK